MLNKIKSEVINIFIYHDYCYGNDLVDEKTRIAYFNFDDLEKIEIELDLENNFDLPLKYCENIFDTCCTINDIIWKIYLFKCGNASNQNTIPKTNLIQTNTNTNINTNIH